MSIGGEVEPAMLAAWTSLLEEPAWEQTCAVASRTYGEAARAGAPATSSFIESGEHGRLIAVTSAPWCSEQHFIRTLPAGSYLAFISPYRRSFRDLPDWRRRKFAHWIFLEGVDEHGDHDLSVSLFYLWDFDSFLRHIGRQGAQAQGTALGIRLPTIVPTSVLMISPSDLLIRILQEDAAATAGA